MHQTTFGYRLVAGSLSDCLFYFKGRLNKLQYYLTIYIFVSWQFVLTVTCYFRLLYNVQCEKIMCKCEKKMCKFLAFKGGM